MSEGEQGVEGDWLCTCMRVTMTQMGLVRSTLAQPAKLATRREASMVTDPLPFLRARASA